MGAHVSQVITSSDLAGVGTALCIFLYIEQTLTGGGPATMSAKHIERRPFQASHAVHYVDSRLRQRVE